MLKDLQAYWAKQSFDLVCKNCGKEFVAQRSYAKFCSRSCKHAVHEKRRYTNRTPGMIKKMERNKVAAKEWRKRMVEEGKCTRCGQPKVAETKICSECISNMKGGSW